MNRLITIWRSAVGKKAAMALTGIVFYGFVLAHMAGNLKMFLGSGSMNTYAEWLREVGYPALPHGAGLWIFRIVLLASVAIHVVAATQLTLLNRRARPEAYRQRASVQLDLASRTMRWSGYLLFAYIVFHLMDLTIGNVNPAFVPGDAYNNLVHSLGRWPVGVVYIVATVLLGFHLYHGLWSLFQSLGWNHEVYKNIRRPFAIAFAVIICAGFLSVPISVLAGWLEPSPETANAVTAEHQPAPPVAAPEPQHSGQPAEASAATGR